MGQNDWLRDPIWQFIGVVISLIGVVVSLLPEEMRLVGLCIMLVGLTVILLSIFRKVYASKSPTLSTSKTSIQAKYMNKVADEDEDEDETKVHFWSPIWYMIDDISVEDIKEIFTAIGIITPIVLIISIHMIVVSQPFTSIEGVILWVLLIVDSILIGFSVVALFTFVIKSILKKLFK